MTDQQFGLEIIAARERRGWLQKELARRLQRKPSQVCAWEKGKEAPPRQDVLLMVRLFDDYAFSLAVARYYTLGMIGVSFDLVQGDRAGAALCVEQEMEDVIRGIQEIRATLLAPALETEAERMEALCVELAELRAAADEKIKRFVAAYGLSALRIAAKTAERAVARGYIETKKAACSWQAA